MISGRRFITALILLCFLFLPAAMPLRAQAVETGPQALLGKIPASPLKPAG